MGIARVHTYVLNGIVKQMAKGFGRVSARLGKNDVCGR